MPRSCATFSVIGLLLRRRMLTGELLRGRGGGLPLHSRMRRQVVRPRWVRGDLRELQRVRPLRGGRLPIGPLRPEPLHRVRRMRRRIQKDQHGNRTTIHHHP